MKTYFYPIILLSLIVALIVLTAFTFIVVSESKDVNEMTNMMNANATDEQELVSQIASLEEDLSLTQREARAYRSRLEDANDEIETLNERLREAELQQEQTPQEQTLQEQLQEAQEHSGDAIIEFRCMGSMEPSLTCLDTIAVKTSPKPGEIDLGMNNQLRSRL